MWKIEVKTNSVHTLSKPDIVIPLKRRLPVKTAE